MGWISFALARTIGMFRQESISRQFSEEWQSHRDLLIEDYLRQGMSASEARRQAAVTLRNLDAVRDEYFAAARWPWIDHLVLDVKLAFADLRRSPSFAISAIISVALGILGASVIFTLQPMIKGVPFFGPSAKGVHLITEYARQGMGEWNNFYVDVLVSPEDYQRWHKGSHSFAELAAARHKQVSVATHSHKIGERLDTWYVTPELFPLLRVNAALGRVFEPSSAVADAQSVVVSHDFWTNYLSSDASVIGSSLIVDGQPYRLIGVAPEHFPFLRGADLWVPARLPTTGVQVSTQNWIVLGRLAAGASPSAAQAELDSLLNVHNADPYTWASRLRSVSDTSTEIAGIHLRIAVAGATSAFLIACINVGVLQLARVISRTTEFGVRIALGAAPIRIGIQVLIQTLLIALAACIVVNVAMFPISRILVSVLPAMFPRLAFSSRAIWRAGCVWSFVFAGSATVLCAALPIVRALRSKLPGTPDISTGFKNCGAARSFRVRSALVVFQMAFALALFVGAGHMLRTSVIQAWLLRQHRANDFLTVAVAATNSRDSSRIQSQYDEMLQKLSTIPGVRSVSFSDHLPFDANPAFASAVRPLDMPRGKQSNLGFAQTVSPSYFPQFSMKLMRGRIPTDADRTDANVAIINASLARRSFGTLDAIGRQLRVEDRDEVSPWLTVIGIVEDMRICPISSGMEPTLYRLQSAATAASVYVLVEGKEDLANLSTAVSERLAQMNGIKLFNKVRPMAEGGFQDPRRSLMTVLMLFAVPAAFALLLAALGVYALLHHWATERQLEVTIRKVLGASRTDILCGSLRQTTLLLVASLAIGIPLAFIFADLIRQTMMIPLDAHIFLLCSAAILTIVLAATCVPARAATKLDPLSVLRAE